MLILFSYSELFLLPKIIPAARHRFKTESTLAATQVGTVGTLSQIASLQPAGPTVPTYLAWHLRLQSAAWGEVPLAGPASFQAGLPFGCELVASKTARHIRLVEQRAR